MRTACATMENPLSWILSNWRVTKFKIQIKNCEYIILCYRLPGAHSGSYRCCCRCAIHSRSASYSQCIGGEGPRLQTCVRGNLHINTPFLRVQHALIFGGKGDLGALKHFSLISCHNWWLWDGLIELAFLKYYQIEYCPKKWQKLHFQITFLGSTALGRERGPNDSYGWYRRFGQRTDSCWHRRSYQVRLVKYHWVF